MKCSTPSPFLLDYFHSALWFVSLHAQSLERFQVCAVVFFSFIGFMVVFLFLNFTPGRNQVFICS